MTASNIGNGPDKNFNAKEERKVQTVSQVSCCSMMWKAVNITNVYQMLFSVAELL